MVAQMLHWPKNISKCTLFHKIIAIFAAPYNNNMNTRSLIL